MENKYRIYSQNLCSGNGTEDWQKVCNRAPHMIEKFGEYRPDVICVQEGTQEWMGYLKDGLTEVYDFQAVARDSRENSECCAIFYKKERFEMLATKTFWLSKTPDRMSGSWITACLRICTYVLLKDKNTGTEIAVFNTHLDHKSHMARLKGAKLIVSKIHELAKGKHVILTGDMNTFEKTLTYNVLANAFNDAKFNARYSMMGQTYQDYGSNKGRFWVKPIDYVFVGKEDGVTVNNYKIIKDKDKNDHFLSDHYGLLVDVEY